jgi:hypothetical protein
MRERVWCITRDDGDERARAFCAALAKRFKERPMGEGLPHNAVVAFDPVDGALELGPGLRAVVANRLVLDHFEMTLDGVEAYLRQEAARE